MDMFWEAMRQGGRAAGLSQAVMAARESQDERDQLITLINLVVHFAKTGEIGDEISCTTVHESVIGFTRAMIERDGRADGPDWFVQLALTREIHRAEHLFGAYLSAILAFVQNPGVLPTPDELRLPA